jgi:oxygen-independent coproporphyrinogen-3 oxidase
MNQAHRLFVLDAGAEQSIEVDPRTVSPGSLATLRDLGFNRLSLGVQDFDAEVQAQVHRIQSPRQVARLVESARNLDFRSVNFDLIYGLPGQTRNTFACTLDRVLEIGPDRIALYPFAYLPHVFSHQRKLAEEALPRAEEKLAIFLAAQERLVTACYNYIGMDHFALRDDELSHALREGTLQRNFMGYTTQAGSGLIGFGVSAISEMRGRYWQNEKRLSRYEARVGEGMLPAVRGLELSADDLLRKEVIAALLCHGRVDLGALSSRRGMDLWSYFAEERRRLDEMEADDLVYTVGRTIAVTESGRLLLRAIAQVFDAYVAPGENKGVVHSKTI